MKIALVLALLALPAEAEPLSLQRVSAVAAVVSTRDDGPYGGGARTQMLGGVDATFSLVDSFFPLGGSFRAGDLLGFTVAPGNEREDGNNLVVLLAEARAGAQVLWSPSGDLDVGMEAGFCRCAQAILSEHDWMPFAKARLRSHRLVVEGGVDRGGPLLAAGVQAAGMRLMISGNLPRKYWEYTPAGYYSATAGVGRLDLSWDF